MIWLAVTDMDETLGLVTAHGGQILTPPAPDGPARILATITDPEGNPVGLAATHRPALKDSASGGRAEERAPPLPLLQCNPVIISRAGEMSWSPVDL